MDGRSTRRQFVIGAVAAWPLTALHRLHRTPAAHALADGFLTSAAQRPLWTPASLGVDLIHWWDASDISSLTIDRGTGRLTAWRDKVGGIVASQSSQAHRPLVRQGEVRFAGTGIALNVPNLSRAY